MNHRQNPNHNHNRVGYVPADADTYQEAIKHNIASATDVANSKGQFIRCPVHNAGRVVFHIGCLHQDAVNPEGIVLVPIRLPGAPAANFYLSKRNFELWELKRLKHLENKLKTACEACIHDEIKRISEIDPNKYIDLTDGKLAT